MVMCSEPVTRTPWSGLSFAYLRRMAIRPGISNSAMEISLRPQSASARSATLKSAVLLIVAVPIKNSLVSRNLDTLILEYFNHGVNPQIPAPRRRSDPRAAAGAGRAFGGRIAGHPRQGTEPDFHAPGAVEAGRPGGRPPHRQERVLPPDGARRPDGAASQGGRRGPGVGRGPAGPPPRPAQAPGPDAALLRRTGRQVRPPARPGPLVERRGGGPPEAHAAHGDRRSGRG